MLRNGNKTIPQWCGCKNKNTLKRTKIKSINTDAVSQKYQFGIIFTYYHYSKLLSRCSTKFVGSCTPPRWILGGSNLVHDTTTTMPGPCSDKSPSPREGRGHCRRRRRSAVGNTWAGWGSVPERGLVCFPGMAGHPCLILRATSLSLQGGPANIGKG